MGPEGICLANIGIAIAGLILLSSLGGLELVIYWRIVSVESKVDQNLMYHADLQKMVESE